MTMPPHTPAASDGSERFLDAVRARLDDSLRYATRLADSAVAGLGTSELLTATTLEGCVRDLVAAGGKLVRPRLVRLGHLAVLSADEASADAAELMGTAGLLGTCDVTSTPATSPVVDVAAAFELLHVFGLLQDDVMDASATRRGRPSAHRRVADIATPAQGASPADVHAATKLGESVAVLAGDLAFTLANRLVRRVPERVAAAWDETAVELVQGQRLDLLFAVEGRVDEASTRRVAQAKSGAYTVLRPLQLGALLTGLDAVPAWLDVYGTSLGEAFALADDVIGLWGDPAVTGKPVGEDLRERKPSTVIGIADAMLDGALSRRLASPRTELNGLEIDDLVATMTAAGVRDEAERRIAACRERAIASTSSVANADVRAQLVRFAHEISDRDA